MRLIIKVAYINNDRGYQYYYAHEAGTDNIGWFKCQLVLRVGTLHDTMSKVQLVPIFPDEPEMLPEVL